MSVINSSHDPIVMVLRHGVDAAIEKAQFCLVRTQLPLRGDIEGDRISSSANGVNNLDSCRAMLPVERQIVVIAMKFVFTRMPVARPVGKAGNQGGCGGYLLSGLQIRRRIIQICNRRNSCGKFGEVCDQRWRGITPKILHSLCRY